MSCSCIPIHRIHVWYIYLPAFTIHLKAKCRHIRYTYTSPMDLMGKYQLIWQVGSHQDWWLPFFRGSPRSRPLHGVDDEKQAERSRKGLELTLVSPRCSKLDKLVGDPRYFHDRSMGVGWSQTCLVVWLGLPPSSFCRDHSMNDPFSSTGSKPPLQTGSVALHFTVNWRLNHLLLESSVMYFFHVMVSSNHSNLESASNLWNPSIFCKNGSGATHVQAFGALGP